MIYLARRAYRPFQSDSQWEWPFTRQSFALIQNRFEIENVQGVLGYGKFALPLLAWPIRSKWLNSLGMKLHRLDIEQARQIDSRLYRCMHVALCLKKRED